MRESSIDIREKTCLITGGTSGVGKAIATGLARRGAKVVIVSRSDERGREALREIAEATGNENGEHLTADLSLQASIRRMSEEFKRKYDRLPVLVNAGGAIYFDKQVTSEGIERSFAINYLSHFCLTNELLDMMKESRPSRVITVAGAPRFLKRAAFRFDDAQLLNHFGALRAAAQSLFARVIFSYELARRLEGTGVRSFAFHPGLIRSNLIRQAPWYFRAYGKLSNRRAKKNCEVGVFLASARELEQSRAVFFNDDMREMDFPNLRNEKWGSRLWRMSEELTGR